MKQTTKTIAALHWTDGQWNDASWFVGSALPEPLVRAGLVIVLDELDQHLLQVSPTEDQQVVEQLPTCCPNPPLRE